MKLITYEKDGCRALGKITDDNQICPLAALGISYTSMNDLIDNITADEVAQIKNGTGETISFDAVKKCSPIPEPKQDVICLGINYLAHADEAAHYKEDAFGGERPYAIYFSKRVNEAVPDGGDIDAHTDMVERLDYESELAVIIGKEAQNVKPEEAYDYVFGYTVLNDISAREVQTNHKQWYFGKSLDGFTPIGPCIVTTDEIPGRPRLNIRSYVNGELRQNSNTDLLISDIPHVICELSRGMTLKPGTIISMGTPAGVGMGFDPPKFLKPGDVVCCEIEGIGTLTNTIR